MSTLPITSVFNDGYIAEAYDAWRNDPESVDESWRQFFRMAEQLVGPATAASGSASPDALRTAAGAASLIAAIRRFGHLAVQIDPLGTAPHGAPELAPEFHGITEASLDTIPARAVGVDIEGTAADAIRLLRQRYAGAIAYEFEHLSDDDERQWFRQMIESGDAAAPLSAEDRRALLQRLTQVDGMERFLGRAYMTTKRFSIEGLDVLVPVLDEAIARAGDAGARHAVIGMAHRGRLNVLVHVMGKGYRSLIEEFEEHFAHDAPDQTGDVKYHMGYRNTREFASGARVQVELVPNPSHLEFANPVVMGVARARQRIDGAAPGTRDEASVLPVIVHGDAAFPGEGVVAETLNMALLRTYRAGGTLHVIANNQVGFTTDPTDSRSTHYSSDLAKGFEVPVLHVSADDAEACIQAVRLAIAYRKRFGADILIDLVGYRRHGHNEADQPAFTQPRLYETIGQHPTPREVYGARLVRERVATEAEVQAMEQAVAQELQSTYETVRAALAGGAAHPDMPEAAPPGDTPETGVRAERLVSLNEQLLTWPSNFAVHPTIKRTLPRRRDMLQSGIDWGHAESLAFASLVTDGVGVRITGQDVERGTFSHRHAVLHDVTTGERHVPLATLPQARAAFEIGNSPLSETAVLAFEYGFSVAAERDLVLWEAQFGDFANVAQPVIDQFMVADYAKWGQCSRLVLLLPHGYEGQGPEHSSARLERFLQLYAEGNMAVAYPSTPAQYFHVLRRQALQQRRRPLVLMQPKSLLRLPAAASSLDDLATGQFHRVIDDPVASRNREAVQRLVLCTGKVYYDLAAAEGRPDNVALIRVEELAPWPREVGEVVDRYPNAEEIVWVQEEPKNMGAWTYVQPRLRASVGTMPILRYIGRPERASPAEGHKRDHDVEQARIVGEALSYVTTRRKAGAAR
jgi:2-oxoglutarate dehydrogenase E1 component